MVRNEKGLPGGLGAQRGSISRDREAAPLWQQVRDDLLRRIDAEAFVSAFPGEFHLADVYGVSRQTIRRALHELRMDGLVTAERGRQSQVRAPYVEQPLGALYSLFDSVERVGMVQRNLVRRLDARTNPEAAERLELKPSEPLVYLERLRLAQDMPLAYDRVWLPYTLTHMLLKVDFRHTALYAELADRCDIRLTGGDERIRAVSPTQFERHLLSIPAGVAALSIERVTYTQRRPVEWRLTVVRGDQFAVSAHFDSSHGYQVRLGQPGST